MAILVLLALTSLSAQSEPIGELSKEAFLNAVADLGYTTSNLGDSYEAALTSGSTSIPLTVSFYSHGTGKPRFVGQAMGTVMFELPRTRQKKYMQEWLANQKLPGLSVHSFLGGKVALQGPVMASTKDPSEKVKQNIERLLEGTRRLKRELVPMGGRESADRTPIGKATIDLNLELDVVEPEDLDNMREQWKWGKQVLPGGGKGWATGAEPLGVPIVFTGMDGSKPGFFLICVARTDPEKYKRFKVKTETLTWASVGVGPREVHIQKWIDTRDGKTVREVRDQILAFAKHVKDLDVLPIQ